MHPAIQTQLVQSYIAELHRSARAEAPHQRRMRPLSARANVSRSSSRSEDVRVSLVRRMATRFAF